MFIGKKKIALPLSPKYGSRILSLFSLVFIASYPGIALETEKNITQHVEAVATHLIGVMDTSIQAATSDTADVRMTTCSVKLEPENSHLNVAHAIFLYQEQALTNKLNQPYRQRFLRLAPSINGRTVESKSFLATNPEKWIGLCTQPKNSRLVQASEVSDRQCSVFLVPIESSYVGTTQPGGCDTNLRGAVTITNRILLHGEGMDTWDRGFDAQGNQVWGAQDIPYQFRWLN